MEDTHTQTWPPIYLWSTKGGETGQTTLYRALVKVTAINRAGDHQKADEVVSAVSQQRRGASREC